MGFTSNCLRIACLALLCTAPFLSSAAADIPPLAAPGDYPPDGGETFNRLIFEPSPYLRQHARNPVDWYPWGEEAFERARKEEKPVFLSIGYATCHWCHVMERESFQDPKVAKLLNKHFIAVKVDREERPDLDQYYMNATLLMSGHGGWPMTVLLTPDREPFYAGTYFPKESVGVRTGLLDLLDAVHQDWTEHRTDIRKLATSLSQHLRELATGDDMGTLPTDILAQCYSAHAKAYDEEHAGFGDAPKFPSPHQLSFLLRYHQQSGEAKALRMVRETLEAMEHGGIHDPLAGGFHRYSTDREWKLPHFEKMLYDQALIAMAYLECAQATGQYRYRRLAEQILDFCLAELQAEQGAFYAAIDADSEGEEGLYYLWTTAQVREVLSEEETALAIDLYQLEDEGNFVDEASGKRSGRNVLLARRDVEAVASRHRLTPEALLLKTRSLRNKLLTARKKRIPPITDNQILTDWNGLIIAALARSGRETDLRAATRAAGFLLTELRDEEGRLRKRWSAGHAGLPAHLDDYAYLGWGLLELHQATQDPRWLRQAMLVTNRMLEDFEDPVRGGFFFGALTPDLDVRTRVARDGARPSGNSIAAMNLLRLSRLTGSEHYRKKAESTLSAFAKRVRNAPVAYAAFLQAWQYQQSASQEVVILMPDNQSESRMLNAMEHFYRPHSVRLLIRPETHEIITKLAPYTRPFRSHRDAETAYVCENFACREPTTDLKAFLKSLKATAAENQR